MGARANTVLPSLFRHGHGGHDQQLYTLCYRGSYNAAVVGFFRPSAELDPRCPQARPLRSWGLPASRTTAVASHLHLTEEESKMLSRTIISAARPTASHPRNFPGARAMSATETKKYGSIGS